MQIAFKNKTRIGNNFHFKDWSPKDLTSGVVYKFQCGLCNESYYGGCVWDTWMPISSSVSPLTKKEVMPKNNSVADHVLFCNQSASYDDFSILTRENKKFLLELKDSLLIMRDNPPLNRNINRHHCIYSTGPSNNIFVIIYLFLIVATLFLLNGLFII